MSNPHHIRKLKLQNSNKVARVDAGEYAALLAHRWFLDPKGYVMRRVRVNGKWGMMYLHRQLTGAPRGMDVDHVNGDPLDNRLANLRVCTRRQNLQNAAAKRTGNNGKPSTSVFKGVSQKGVRWQARIRIGGKQTHLGVFDTERQAATAYNHVAVKEFGEYAKLNLVYPDCTCKI
jgi:hypothetical protein